MSNKGDYRDKQFPRRTNQILVWGSDRQGRMCHVSNEGIQRGLACHCTCPLCGSELMAKKGIQRVHHFAHHDGRDCPDAPETGLHLAAKDIIQRECQMMLPALSRRIKPLNGDNHDETREWPLLSARLCTFDRIELECLVGDIIPDIVAHKNGWKLFIEIRVTHEVDQNKIDKIRQLGHSCLEIDLSMVDRDIDPDSLRSLLIDSIEGKTWIWNRRADTLAMEFLAGTALMAIQYKATKRRVFGCPIPPKRPDGVALWSRGEPYANAHECRSCPHMIDMSDAGGLVICNGFQYQNKPIPPALMMPKEFIRLMYK